MIIGRDRRYAARRRRSIPAMLCLVGLLSLPGCSDLRQAIGLDKNAPDEFAVESRLPLTIPPEFSLRPPEPGAQRPQSESAAQQARAAIEKAGPGKPGDQASNVVLPRTGSLPGLGGPNPNDEVRAGSLSQKLLEYVDKGDAVAVDKRETAALKGVY